MKTWDAFLPDVLPEVPGCPEVEAEHAIKRAAQEFCRSTHVWRIWLADITTADGVTDYDIELEPNTDLVELKRATLDGREILVTTTDQLPADWKTYPDGLRDCVHTSDRRTLVLLPAKDAGLVLKTEASLSPSDASAGLEDKVYDMYCEDIAKGALARLMAKAGKSYSNPNDAAMKRDEFTEAMARVSIQVGQGFSANRRRARGNFY